MVTVLHLEFNSPSSSPSSELSPVSGVGHSEIDREIFGWTFVFVFRGVSYIALISHIYILSHKARGSRDVFWKPSNVIISLSAN